GIGAPQSHPQRVVPAGRVPINEIAIVVAGDGEHGLRAEQRDRLTGRVRRERTGDDVASVDEQVRRVLLHRHECGSEGGNIPLTGGDEADTQCSSTYHRALSSPVAWSNDIR